MCHRACARLRLRGLPPLLVFLLAACALDEDGGANPETVSEDPATDPNRETDEPPFVKGPLPLEDWTLNQLLSWNGVEESKRYAEIERRISLCTQDMDRERVFEVLKLHRRDFAGGPSRFSSTGIDLEFEPIVNDIFVEISDCGPGFLLGVSVVELSNADSMNWSRIRVVATAKIDCRKPVPVDWQGARLVRVDDAAAAHLEILLAFDFQGHRTYEEKVFVAYSLVDPGRLEEDEGALRIYDAFGGDNPGHRHTSIDFLGPGEPGFCLDIYYSHRFRKYGEVKLSQKLRLRFWDFNQIDLGQGMTLTPTWKRLQ